MEGQFIVWQQRRCRVDVELTFHVWAMPGILRGNASNARVTRFQLSRSATLFWEGMTRDHDTMVAIT